MNRRFISLLLIIMLSVFPLPVSAAVNYGPPYAPSSTTDRLAEAMPTVFDVNTWPKTVLGEEDFEDTTYDGGLTYLKKVDTAVFKIEAGIGSNSNGCLVVPVESPEMSEGLANHSTAFYYDSEPEELQPGDFVAFTCMMKGEDIVTDDSGFRPIVQVYGVYEDGTREWLTEDNENRLTADSDWVQITNFVMIPEVDIGQTKPEYYRINLSCNVGNTTGTMYFDDLKLYKLQFHPMDVVLMDPVYKGIVKGKGGISDISLRAYIHECNGVYDYDSMNFTARITDEAHNVLIESNSETVTGVMDAHFSSETLPMGGNFWAECVLTDKETGVVIQQQEYGIYKRGADFETIMDIDEYGRVVRNGEPYFPITVMNSNKYLGEPTEGGVIDGEHQSTTLYQNFDETTQTAFVQGLASAGKSFTVSIGCLAFGSHHLQKEPIKSFTAQTDSRAFAERLTNNLKNEETLAFYYLWDEVNAMRYGQELAWINKIFTHNDLDHPTTAAIRNEWSSRPGIYAKMTDVVGYDPYVVTGKADQKLSTVTEEILEAKRLNPNRPILMFPQGFCYRSRGDLRAPYQNEFKNMCFQGIIAGACMFDMYYYPDLIENDTGIEGKTGEELWQEYEAVFSEIKAIEPIIMSTLPAPYYEVENGGTWFNHMTKRYDGKSYLFAVNNENAVKTAKVHLDGATTITGLYSDATYTADGNGWFTIELDGYETEVFEYAQADYESSHADLRNFAAANYCVLDSESETPTIVIDDAAVEMNYRAYMSDYAKLYINGEAAPESGMINISGLDQLDLRVVSQDGRVSTEKTYLLEGNPTESFSLRFSNGTEVFTVSEGEENTLYVPAGSGVINYTASISTGAALYIGSKEMPTTGKITVRNCNRFYITVLASDGKTKTTKYYQVVKQ